MEIEKIKETDFQIAEVIADEFKRQNNTIELIASENIASPAVMAAQGSILTNKYAEGYPDKRYYGGCECVDIAEKLAIERAKELFGAKYANVQPHSGSQANMATYFSLLNPGDAVMGMDLTHGGHLTHGSPASFSGRLYNFAHYGVRKDTGRIDFDQVADLAKKNKPRLIVAGSSAYPRIIDFEIFARIAKSIDAYLMVDMAHIAGEVAAGIHPSPVPFADVVTSTTHKTLRGPRGGLILSSNDFAKKLNKEIFPGIQGGPLMHVIAAKAIAFKEALKPSFKEYMINVVENSKAMASILMENDLDLTSGGTDNHMILIDLTNLDITGKDAEEALGKAGITVNKNTVPFEKRSPFITSGIRIGTPAITTRGLKVNEIKVVAQLIADVLKNHSDQNIIAKTRAGVSEICEAFPLYKDQGVM